MHSKEDFDEGSLRRPGEEENSCGDPAVRL
jgi:hypothetical protein